MGVFRVSSSNSSMITGGQSSSRQGHKFHGRVWVEVGVESRQLQHSSCTSSSRGGAYGRANRWHFGSGGGGRL